MKRTIYLPIGYGLCVIVSWAQGDYYAAFLCVLLMMYSSGIFNERA